MDIVGEAGLRWSKFLPQSSLISNGNTIENVILYMQARSLAKITVVSGQNVLTKSFAALSVKSISLKSSVFCAVFFFNYHTVH